MCCAKWSIKFMILKWQTNSIKENKSHLFSFCRCFHFNKPSFITPLFSVCNLKTFDILVLLKQYNWRWRNERFGRYVTWLLSVKVPGNMDWRGREWGFPKQTVCGRPSVGICVRCSQCSWNIIHTVINYKCITTVYVLVFGWNSTSTLATAFYIWK